MNDDVKALWVEALRSGKYNQGKGWLRQRTPNGGKFCCLGVLCDLAVRHGVTGTPVETESGIYRYGPESYTDSVLPDTVQTWAGLPFNDPGVDGVFLTNLNDEGRPFAEIADVIESGHSWA